MIEASGKRRKDTSNDLSWTFHEPEMSPMRLQEIERAANEFAKRHASDPFSYGRIFLHMKRGLISPAEVISDARGTPI